MKNKSLFIVLFFSILSIFFATFVSSPAGAVSAWDDSVVPIQAMVDQNDDPVLNWYDVFQDHCPTHATEFSNWVAGYDNGNRWSVSQNSYRQGGSDPYYVYIILGYESQPLQAFNYSNVYGTAPIFGAKKGTFYKGFSFPLRVPKVGTICSQFYSADFDGPVATPQYQTGSYPNRYQRLQPYINNIPVVYPPDYDGRYFTDLSPPEPRIELDYTINFSYSVASRIVRASFLDKYTDPPSSLADVEQVRWLIVDPTIDPGNTFPGEGVVCSIYGFRSFDSSIDCEKGFSLKPNKDYDLYAIGYQSANERNKNIDEQGYFVNFKYKVVRFNSSELLVDADTTTCKTYGALPNNLVSSWCIEYTPYQDCLSSVGTDGLIEGFACVVNNFGIWLRAMLIQVFVPAGDFIDQWLDSFNDFWVSKLGFVYQSLQILYNTINNIIALAVNPTCTLTVSNGQLFGQSVSFDLCYFETAFSGAFQTMRALVIGATSIGLVFAGFRKYNDVMEAK